jgi:hypothetical protein
MAVRCDTLVRIAGAAAFHRGATLCSAWTDLIASSVLRSDGLTPVSFLERLAHATAPGSAETEEDSQ